MARKLETLDKVKQQLAACGITPTMRYGKGGHMILNWSVNGKPPRMYVLASSTRHKDAGRQALADIRRMLRQDGLLAKGIEGR